MASGDISTTDAGDTFISLLRVHLERFGILKQPKQGEATARIKRTRRMEITEHLRKLKNSERKNRRLDKSFFNNLVRAHNKAKKINQKLITDSKLRSHVKAFRSNPWHYTKKIHSDSSNTSSLDCSPSQAYSHFAESFKDDGGYCALPSWVSQVQHVPSEDDWLEFDLSPITTSINKESTEETSF